MAEAAFKAALKAAESCTPEESIGLVPLIHLNQCLILRKQDQSQEANQLLAEATAQLEAVLTQPDSRGFVYLTASTLHKLGDYRRAIPYWEQSIESADDDANSDGIATKLHRLGECYSRIGLKDHAAVPLCAALKLLEFCHEDPRRSAVLITLGNALRKSSPAEAESCYKEAAEAYASRLQYEAAAPAWNNLGILCSEQGRHEEALDYHQKALHVRLQSPNTQRLAGSHNNIGACYMRMGRFAEAHESVDRALQLATTDDSLASACSTKGMIFQKSGDYFQAVKWLRRATAERQKQASPDMESIADDINREIDCLKKLDRLEEVTAAETSLADVRTQIAAIAPSDPSYGASQTPLEGAVTIEITHQNGQNHLRNNINFKKLELSLMYDAEEEKTGHLSGVVTVPGNTTLIFYGNDSEALYRALEPRLNTNLLLKGALITIRQRDVKREILIPRDASQLN